MGIAPLLIVYLWAPSAVWWLVLLVLVGAYGVARWWYRPGRELMLMARRLRAGEWGARTAEPLHGEWAEIAEALGDLAQQLHAVTSDLEGQVEERTRALGRKADQLRALGQIGQQVAAVLVPGELLHFVVRLIRGTFRYDAVAILQDYGQHLVVSACAARGIDDPPVGRAVLRTDPAFAALIDSTRKGDESQGDPVPLIAGLDPKVQLAVPLSLGQRILGALIVQRQDPEAFDEDDAFTVRTIAGQVAVALENARLFEAEREWRDLAITQERNRMAREIHDTLAQGFMGILMHLRAMQGATDPAVSDLHRGQAESLAKESLDEARRSVWNLRPRSLDGKGLRGALEEEVERVQTQAGIAATLRVLGSADQVGAQAAAALLRIAQEALHNTVKHAGATQVEVRLAIEGGEALLHISDNGRDRKSVV